MYRVGAIDGEPTGTGVEIKVPADAPNRRVPNYKSNRTLSAW